MYALSAYRYDCPTAQHDLWDHSPERIKERSPETFTGEYAYTITQLVATGDGYKVGEIVEQSPNYVSWRDYEPVEEVVYVGRCRECERRLTSEEFFYGHDCEVD